MRKLVLIVLSLVAVVAVTGTLLTRTEFGQDQLLERGLKAAMSAQAYQQPEGLRVVICGSASPLGNDPERAQACIAILTQEHFLLFDVGARSPLRIAQAGLPLQRLNGVFLSHFHSDHIAALPDVNLGSWVRGRRESLRIYGPAGVDQVVNGFNTAYSQDFSYRTAHHGQELLPQNAGPMTAVTLSTKQVAWEENGLRVQAFRVAHDPVKPAVGYRIDYKGRSVVISGDSNATDELFTAAKDADLLLHDALSRALLDPMIETATELQVPVMPQIMRDVIDYHADSLSLEARAEAAGVKQLALYHLVPAPTNSVAEAIFRRGLADSTLLVKDLQTFDLPPNSTAINISMP